MTTFDRREAALEAAFVHGEHERFRALARATRELARWAAGAMGKDEAAAEQYADEVLAMRLEAGDHRRIVDRIAQDLARAGRGIGEAAVAAKADALLQAVAGGRGTAVA